MTAKLLLGGLLAVWGCIIAMSLIQFVRKRRKEEQKSVK
jgi:hypothetical protein